MKLPQPIAHRIVKGALRTSFKWPSLLPLPVVVLRQAMEGGTLLFRPRPEAIVEKTTLGGVAVERISPPGRADRVLLHFHGGAFFAGSANTHRALGSELALRGTAQVIMVDYRRAPEHPYPAALQDGLACYHALLEKGWRGDQIVLGGDSGGCAHILSLALTLRDRGLPMPAGMVMISPYLDITLSLPSVARNARRDPMVTAHALRRGGDGYRGNIPENDPRVSPLFADLHGLPPVLVQAGSEEILLDDALQFSERAQAAGVAVHCHIYAGLWHNFQMFNALIAEADDALDEIGAFIKEA